MKSETQELDMINAAAHQQRQRRQDNTTHLYMCKCKERGGVALSERHIK